LARKTSKEYLGKIYINKYGTLLKIISCQNYHHVDCLDITHNIIIKNISIGNLEKQYIKSPLDKTLYNIGYIGVGNHQPKDNLKCYRTWDNIIYRGYSEDYKLKYNTYEECTVCEEWHNFQNFADWFDKNYYEIGKERMEIDKDLLIKNNKIYSPNTCVFVPRRINSLLIKNNKARGKYLVGVDFHNKKFRARCMTLNGSIYLGHFNTEIEAFEKYKKFKEMYIKQVADEYKNVIPKKLYIALYNYKVEMED
jgi:hypothetical protein